MPGCACAAAPKAPPVWPKAVGAAAPKGEVFCWVAPNGEVVVCPNADVVVDPNALGAAAGAPNKPVALDGCVAPKALVVVDPKAPPGVAGEPNKPPGAGAGAPNGVLAGAPKALVCPKPPGVWGEPKADAVVDPNAEACCCGGKPPKAFVVVDAPNVGWLGVPKAQNDMVAASVCARCGFC